MATLTADVVRQYEHNLDPVFNHVPMIADDIIYKGACVGYVDGTGLAKPIATTNIFVGFAEDQADNTGGAASAINVKVRSVGNVVLSVVGAADAGDIGAPVYASDDATFTLTAGSNVKIGKVHRWESGTTCVVHFESDISDVAL